MWQKKYDKRNCFYPEIKENNINTAVRFGCCLSFKLDKAAPNQAKKLPQVTLISLNRKKFGTTSWWKRKQPRKNSDDVSKFLCQVCCINHTNCNCYTEQELKEHALLDGRHPKNIFPSSCSDQLPQTHILTDIRLKNTNYTQMLKHDILFGCSLQGATLGIFALVFSIWSPS